MSFLTMFKELKLIFVDFRNKKIQSAKTERKKVETKINMNSYKA